MRFHNASFIPQMHQCDHREMHPGLPLHDHVAFHDRQVNRYAEDRDSDPRHAIDKKH